MAKIYCYMQKARSSIKCIKCHHLLFKGHAHIWWFVDLKKFRRIGKTQCLLLRRETGSLWWEGILLHIFLYYFHFTLIIFNKIIM